MKDGEPCNGKQKMLLSSIWGDDWPRVMLGSIRGNDHDTLPSQQDSLDGSFQLSYHQTKLLRKSLRDCFDVTMGIFGER